MLRTIKIFLIGLLLMIFIVPLLTIIVPLVLASRYITLFLVATFISNSKYGKPCGVITSYLAQTDTKGYDNNRLVTQVTLNGGLSLEDFIEVFQSRVLQAKLPNGTLLFPELKQYPVSLFGYKFWKNCSNFNIKSCIAIRPKTTGSGKFSMKEVHTIGDELLTGKFPECGPLWKIVLLPSIERGEGEGTSTVMYFVFDHILTDGYSMVNILKALFADHDPKSMIRPHHHPTSLGYYLQLPYKFIQFLGTVVYSTTLKKCPWRIHEDEKSSECVSSISTIEVDDVKIISKKHNVLFSSVVYTVLVGAIKNFYLSKKCSVFEDIPICITLPPRPSHPKTLCNHLSSATLFPPLSEKNSIRRLKMVDKSFVDMRHSVLLDLNYWVILFFGCLPNPIGRAFTYRGFDAIVFSYIPHTSGSWSLGQIGVTDVNMGYQYRHSDMGLIITIISYAGRLCVKCSFNSAVATNKEAAELSKLIDAEILGLMKGV